MPPLRRDKVDREKNNKDRYSRDEVITDQQLPKRDINTARVERHALLCAAAKIGSHSDAE